MKNEVFAEIEEEVKAKIEAFAEKVGLYLERQTVKVIDESNMNASGDTRKSITHSVQRITEGILLEVFAGTSYAVFPHEGTRAHMPPIEPIREWVMQKGLAQRAIHQPKRLSQSFSRKMKTIRHINMKKLTDTTRREFWIVDNIARAIAWKIYRKGTKGIKFFDLALKQAEPRLNEMIEKFAV
jgi:hypothetical protein